MAFQSTAAFDRLLLYMVHCSRSLASVGLAQACPNNKMKIPAIPIMNPLAGFMIIFYGTELTCHELTNP